MLHDISKWSWKILISFVVEEFELQHAVFNVQVLIIEKRQKPESNYIILFHFH